MKKQKKFYKGVCISFLIIFISAGISPAYGQSSPNLGDVNNDSLIDIIDALLIAQYYVGKDPVVFYTNAADVDESGVIDIVDALVVARFTVGLIDTLPPGAEPTPGTLLDNPFEGASWYVDPGWSALAESAGGAAVAGNNTAVVLFNPNTITGENGLRNHLDNACDQESDLILICLNFLPRECDFHWLDMFDDPFEWYTGECIDLVTAILSDPLYDDIRKVMIIEPESLAYLVTHLDIPACAAMNGAGGYIDMIRYTINQLNGIPNTYAYIDIAFSGWLGWTDNFGPAIDIISETVMRTHNGVNSISGFICNTFNYCPLEEPFLPDPNLEVGGEPVKSAIFYNWNSYFGELEYAQDMYTAFVDRGFPESIGMLINTSRNGWGGPDRPAEVSSSMDLATYVDESRIDRRLHRGNWCNQPGGIGEPPRVNPAPHIDAYVWSWPPGYSDGMSDPSLYDPDNPSPSFDQMCDPDGMSIYSPDGIGTGAIPAPVKGRWNQEHFEILLRNAYPPVDYFPGK
jgi:cellulose 1,4-beta-cellobiosidase